MPLYSFPTHASAKEGATVIPTIRLQVCKQLLPTGKRFQCACISPHSGSTDALADPLLLARNAPITYVSAQLGHAKPTTTLQWYSHWIPSNDSHRFMDGLDGAAGDHWHQFGAKTPERGLRRVQVPEKKEAGARIRTADLLITNQLLYRLSYASVTAGST